MDGDKGAILMPDMRPRCSAERKRRERPSVTKRKR